MTEGDSVFFDEAKIFGASCLASDTDCLTNSVKTLQKAIV
mgnify:CR=1 FL=1